MGEMEEESVVRMEGKSGLVLHGFAAKATTMRQGTDGGGGVDAPATRTPAMDSGSSTRVPADP